MTENSKGELIKKKTTNTTPPTSGTPKKKLVIKKVKKVIIKKQPKKAAPVTPDETETGLGSVDKQPIEPKKVHGRKTDRTSSQNRNYANKPAHGNKDNVPRHERQDRPGQKKTYRQAGNEKGQQGDRGKKVFYKKKFGQDGGKPQGQGPKKDFKSGTPANASTSIPKKTDKDRSRKKTTKKNDSYARKDNRREEFQKVFSHRKNKAASKVSSVPDSIDIIDIISISDLAKKMNLKANVIIRKLMELGTMVTINDKIDADTAEIVCSEFNCKVNVVSLFDETVIEEEKIEDVDMASRPPIVTVMGHVDHGKTKLLDAIKSTDVVAGESGGITQHIGAYSVKLDSGDSITFIDTPGHKAFTTMRARGANVTDIVVLVVAADDGVMPQTVEAINHAKAAKVPIIVAVNKIDRETANIDRVKQQLSDYELLPEEWGGSTLFCEVSALKKIGIDNLLENILLQAEMLDLKAAYNVRATGFVLESQIEAGRGVVATILISKGTLKTGDFFVAGVYNGKVRAMYNHLGKRIKVAPPSMPVEITGLEKSPKAGDPFNVTKTEKEAKIISTKRQELNRMEEAKSVKKITLKDLMEQKPDHEQQELKIIIKADVQGSVEALKHSLEKMSNKEIKISVISSTVGAINESDVMLAVAGNAIIIGFHVRPNTKAAEVAEKEKVEIKRYNIIYDVLEDIKASINGLIKPELQEQYLGTIEIKKVFKISKIGTVAGCVVSEGKVKRNSLIRLMRDDILVYSGKISTLKRFKDDVSEVLQGMECGIGLENYNDIKIDDVMEAYEIKEIARSYDDIKE